MSTGEGNEFAEVMERVREWSPSLRIALAKGILDSLQSADLPEPSQGRRVEELIGLGRSDKVRRPPRGASAEEVGRLFQTDRPPPDDETVERWIDEHRMEKYG